MPAQPARDSQQRADRIAGILAVGVIGFALLVLVLWLLRQSEPLALNARWVPIAPLTALMMIAASIAILLTPKARTNNLGTIGAFTSSLAIIGAAVLAGHRHLTGEDNALEHWLSGTEFIRNGLPIGRTSIYTGALFALLGLGLFIGAHRRRIRVVAPHLHLVVLTAALTLLQGYLLDAPLLYGGQAIPVAGLTTIGLVALSVAGVLVCGVNLWPLRLILAQGPRKPERRSRAAFLTLSVFVTGFVLASGAFWYTGARTRERTERLDELNRIADIKAREIAEWYEGHMSTARALSRLPFGMPAIKRLARRAKNEIEGDIMTSFVRDEKFAVAVLVDSAGQVLYGAPQSEDHRAASRRVRQLRAIRRPELLADDLRLVNNRSRLDLWIPLGASLETKHRALGWLLLGINADSALYPKLTSTTLPGASSTIGLWRLDGDTLRAISPLRFDSSAAFRSHLPLDLARIQPLAERIFAAKEFYRGPDSRGVEIVAAARQVAGTEWFLVVQMDRAEIDATNLWLAVRLSVVLAVLLITTIAGAYSITSRRELQATTRELELVRERERNVEELRRSEDRYARAMRGTTDGLWEWDLVNNTFYISPRMRDLVGMSEEDVKSSWSVFLDRAHPEDKVRLQTALEDHFAGRGPYSVEVRVRRPNGTYRWYWTRGECERDASGKPLRIAGALTDITEQRESNEMLRLFRETMERSQDAIILTDVEKRLVVDSNAAAQQALGYTADEMRRVSPFDFVVDMTDEATWSLRVAALQSGVASRRRTLHRRKDGSVFPVEVSVSSMKSSGRDLVLVIARDISDRVRDDEQRARLQEQFLQSQRLESVGRLAGGVAHDFNNLLTVINATADMASSDAPVDSRVRADLIQIREAGDRAALLTRQLLAFSSQQVLRPEFLDVNAVVTHFLKMIRRVIGEDIRITVQTHDGGAFVTADRGQLEQVLMNLSLNARDAMPRGGSLTIDVDVRQMTSTDIGDHPTLRPGRYVRLSVIDTGEGMTPETQAQIFEPFFTTKGPGRGTGLGMPTVYGIVKQSGGDIAIESFVGVGTTVRVFLPPAHADTDPPTEPLSVKPASGSETILVVEDEDAIRFVVRRVLERAGYTIVEAINGAEALSILESRLIPPQMVMTDLVMPGMSGVELAREIRRRWPELPILLASGYSQETLSNEFDAVREWRLIAKPYAVNDLLREVRSILDTRTS